MWLQIIFLISNNTNTVVEYHLLNSQVDQVRFGFSLIEVPYICLQVEHKRQGNIDSIKTCLISQFMILD